MSVHADTLFNLVLDELTRKYIRLFDETTASRLARSSAMSIFVLLFAVKPRVEYYQAHNHYMTDVIGLPPGVARRLLEESLYEEFRSFVMNLHLSIETH